MSTFSIEHAKSGRALCKKCKEKIPQGDLRIGTETGVSGQDYDYSTTSWHHPKCFVISPKLKKEGVTAESFVVDMLVDNTDDNVLQKRRDEVIADIEYAPPKGSGSVSAAKKKEEEGGEGVVAALKAQLTMMRSEAHGEPAAKKPKLSPEDMARVDVYAMYEKHKNDALKDVLKWNRQLVSGTKDLMMARIIDGQLKGRLGRCPMCLRGKLQLEDEHAKKAICKGYFDEDLGVREPCSYACPIDGAPRKHPWFTEKPTEEEEAVMDAESEAARGQSGGDEALEAELMTKAGALEWILDDMQGIKKATRDLIELCNDKVDLPETNKTMEVGKLVAANRSLKAKDVLKLVIDQFGFSQQNEKAAMNKNAAIVTMCEHPANADLVKLFLELGGLYTAEHNHNAASSYKKVANAIRKLDFEITESNAKGLGGGKKTKVEGIGKSSADKIYEFITTGKIEKLEEKRAAAS